ncbi:MAG: GntR family transcriptional regulator [Hyphomicrobiales bacterium]
MEARIEGGMFRSGDKLPPQRDIAYDLGVTIGTISRGYALAHERGLVAGEVGRGTYVLDKTLPGKIARSSASITKGMPEVFRYAQQGEISFLTAGADRLARIRLSLKSQRMCAAGNLRRLQSTSTHQSQVGARRELIGWPLVPGRRTKTISSLHWGSIPPLCPSSRR